jgi:uncharacterized protein (UPF0261 family)
MVNFGALDTVPSEFADRNLHVQVISVLSHSIDTLD